MNIEQIEWMKSTISGKDFSKERKLLTLKLTLHPQICKSIENVAKWVKLNINNFKKSTNNKYLLT